jgi:large subunit ribosomal protein L6
MKTHMKESIAIPQGVHCEVTHHFLHCKKGSTELKRSVNIPMIQVSVQNNEVVIECPAGNKNQLKKIMALVAHVNNLFKGLDKKYNYKLQACNVHFPMTLKVEKDKLLINNFLGEKKPRTALILPNVHVEVKGQNITVSSADKEAAGQTAANFEKATRVRYRDRRIFQDGIYITDKASEESQ